MCCCQLAQPQLPQVSTFQSVRLDPVLSPPSTNPTQSTAAKSSNQTRHPSLSCGVVQTTLLRVFTLHFRYPWVPSQGKFRQQRHRRSSRLILGCDKCVMQPWRMRGGAWVQWRRRRKWVRRGTGWVSRWWKHRRDSGWSGRFSVRWKVETAAAEDGWLFRDSALPERSETAVVDTTRGPLADGVGSGEQRSITARIPRTKEFVSAHSPESSSGTARV